MLFWSITGCAKGNQDLELQFRELEVYPGTQTIGSRMSVNSLQEKTYLAMILIVGSLDQQHWHYLETS